MTDKELLEKAAAAAGMKWRTDAEVVHDGLWIIGVQTYWNPLRDDGDALRLAVNLNIEVDPCDDRCSVSFWRRPEMIELVHETEKYTSDKFAATRRAIVRAAAAIAGEKS